MNKKYDLAVLIGRFQPFHVGHLACIKNALEHANHILILVGSAHQPRDVRNPFTAIERMDMIHNSLMEEKLINHSLDHLVDHMYSDQTWTAQVQAKVDYWMEKLNFTGQVCLTGFKKDPATTRYIELFPQWDFVESPKASVRDATAIRQELFEANKPTDDDWGYLPATISEEEYDLPEAVVQFLSGFIKKPEHEVLCKEWEHLKAYKKDFEGMRYPPIFVTTDAVVICSGHILLVKRKSQPGKGLWALPGGFLKHDELIEDGIIRELVEETRIKVHPNILRGSIKGRHVFDAPGRSLRGRTITHAGLIVLHGELPQVRGADDAERAKWIPINEFYQMKEKLFEDHYSIGTYMIDRAG